ncbi:MAG: FtsX-like permease family protein [Geothrix sp.]|uniref:ABC transporter permease n=1 Tax=Geothrix sp. TaxID=1962974 RepID=UPI00184988A3|nr:FtsX-like permease family protein [Geothrix sp.]NWJ39782.1 FtsX-like permease family protein [Geothrix sp.]WIL22205.1 MAG: FtsX-like permease family protein [Geothrix sp.]
MRAPLQRYRNILDFALSSLLRRKGRNLALLGVYTLVVFVIASLIFFVQALKREARELLVQAPDMVVQRMVAGRHDPIPVIQAEAIRAIRGVEEVQPRLWGYYYDPVYGGNLTVMATGDPALAADAVWIGQGVARSMRVKEGDLISLRSYAGLPSLYAVQKVLPEDSELVSSDLVLMSPGDVRALFNFPEGLATDLAITAGNPRELPTIAAKIVERFPDTRPILKSEILRTYEAIFDWRGGLMVVVLASAILAFIIFAWDKATGLSAEERREIGILKSIGWESADVLLLKVWEGAVISLTAFLSGVLLGYAHVFFFSASLFEHALKGWSVLFPRYRLLPALDAYQLTVLFFLTVLPYTAATLVPIWRAATVDPDAAMRS